MTLLTRSAALGAALAAGAAGASAQTARGDFNGDSFLDLAVGVPGEDGTVWVPSGGPRGSFQPVTNSGAVTIIYSSGGGLTGTGGQHLTQGQGQRDNEAFGKALAAGDFNGDGHSDLAVVAPRDTTGSPLSVYLGSSSGLPGVASQRFPPDAFTVSGLRLHFGGIDDDTAMVAADFDGDGTDDLAVAAQIVGGSIGGECSTVLVLFGQSNENLSSARRQVLVKESSECIGQSLASGDFNLDGRAELVVGLRFDSRVDIHEGTTRVSPDLHGLTPAPRQVLDPLEAPEAGDQFGAALASADFNGDGRPDLAVGAPGKTRRPSPTSIGIRGAGAVTVFFNAGPLGPAHVTRVGAQLFTQDNAGGGERVEEGDGFGAALAAGDFNGDAVSDLAIGVPREDLEGTATKSDAGVTHVVYGVRTSGSSTGGGLGIVASEGHPAAQVWHGDVSGIDGSADPGGQWGASLTAGHYGGGPEMDLVVGVPVDVLSFLHPDGSGGFTVERIAGGAAHALFGSATGLAVAGSEVWHQSVSGIPDAVEAGDRFGESVR